MHGDKYLLDTNVLIGFLAGRDWAVSFMQRAEKEHAVSVISAITRMELLGFANMTGDEEHRIKELLSALQVESIHLEIENLAIHLRRSSRLKLPDAIVAATAIHLKATLVTADDDFAAIDGLQMVNPSALAE